MLNLIKPLELPEKLTWKRPHERELMSWTIRARNYNTFVANCMFGFMLLVILAVTYAGHLSDTLSESSISDILMSIGFFTFLTLTIASMTHQRMNFAYRITQSGLEYCQWKDFPKWVLPFLKWTAGISAVVFVSLASVDPTFLIGALVGPGGMGLLYLRMALSKDFQDMHTHYNHHGFHWKDFTQLAIATNRDIVDLKFSMKLKGDDHITHWNINIHCKRKQKEDVAALIRHYLPPDIPMIRAKVNVPLSTD